MKIWFTEIGEPLPIEEDVRLHRYGMLTKMLSSRGHDVVWWTSSFSHAPKKHVVNDDSDLTVDGVNLRILKGLGYEKNISLQRIRHQKHFSESFYHRAKKQPLPDIIISPVPTIETAEMAVRFSRKFRVPILIDIRDEWPDEFVDLAPKPLRSIAKLFLYPYFEKMRRICMEATGIIAVSGSFLNYGLCFANRLKGENDGVFPLGYTDEPIGQEKILEARKFWKGNGVDENAFVCCFFGTIGKFFDLGTVILVAEILSREFPIQFVLCGEGTSLNHYKQLAAGTDSVFFPGWMDAPKIAALMEISSVGLAPYAKNTRMSLPNKPFEYFAGGLPVVSSIQGEMKHILADNDCGRTYEADSVEQLCHALRELRTDDTLSRDMGKRARQLFEQEFSIERIAKKMEEHLVKVVENYRK
jgi:glycosyltransferase involved in cell wall biosynthesis